MLLFYLIFAICFVIKEEAYLIDLNRLEKLKNHHEKSLKEFQVNHTSNNINAYVYLRKFGFDYVITKNDAINRNFSTLKELNKMESLEKMIRLFQVYFNLNLTGTLNNETLTKMKSPRCGFQDITKKYFNTFFNTVIADYQAISKWNKNDLTYKILNQSRGLNLNQTRRAIKKAFDLWENVANLSFNEVCQTCQSDLVFDFVEFEHGDGYPFDGVGGDLAHAFFPTDGRVHFDESETFITLEEKPKSESEYPLEIVAAHEIGHSLGLDHSQIKGSLMYPYFENSFKLAEDDIEGIQFLYGMKMQQTTTIKTNTTDNLLAIYNPVCNGTIQSIFYGPNNVIYALLNDDDFWEFNMLTKKWKRNMLRNVYPKLPKGVRGGFNCTRNMTWFFKHRRIWAFTGYRLMPGYPKRIDDPYYSVNMRVFSNINETIFLFKGPYIYKFDEILLHLIDMEFTYAKDVFEGLPDNADAFLFYKNEYLFFFNKWVYRYNRSKKLVKKGADLRSLAWEPCKFT